MALRIPVVATLTLLALGASVAQAQAPAVAGDAKKARSWPIPAMAATPF